MPERERALPASPALQGLLPDAGLVRGRVLSCHGPGCMSLAFATVADAVATGAWLAVVSVPGFGVEAAIDMGVDPVRIVSIDASDPLPWVDVIAASLDGFEIVVTSPPERLAESLWRKVQARVRSRDAVLVTVGDHRVVAGDIELRTSNPTWTWARGVSHLQARRIQIEVTGRRIPRPRHAQLWLPSQRGGVELAEPLDIGTSRLDEHTQTMPTRRLAG